MEPVEININMNQNVSEEADKATKGMNSIGDAATQVSKIFEKQARTQTQALEQMSQKLDTYQAKLSQASLSPSADHTLIDQTMQRISDVRLLIDQTNEKLSKFGDSIGLPKNLYPEIVAIANSFTQLNTNAQQTAVVLDTVGAASQAVTESVTQTETKTSQAAEKLSTLGMTTREIFVQSKQALEGQEALVASLATQLDNAQKKLTGMPAGQQRDTFEIEQVDRLGLAYEDAKAKMAQLTVAHEGLSTSAMRVTQTLRDLENEIIRVSALDGDHAAEITALKDRYKELGAAYLQLTTEMKLGKESGGRATMQGITQGVMGLTGAMSAGVGVMGLFNAKSEEMQAIQTKVQSLMAITIGLEQISNLLAKENAFYTVIIAKIKREVAAAILQVKVAEEAELATKRAAIVADVEQTAALAENTVVQEGSVVATTELAAANVVEAGAADTASVATVGFGTALKALWIMMLENPITAIIAGVALLAVAMYEWTTSSRAALAVQNQIIDSREKAINSVQDQVTHIEELNSVVNDNTVSMKARLGAMEELNKIEPAYNGYLDEEHGKIVANTSALTSYIAALRASAEAKANEADLSKAIQEQRDYISSETKEGFFTSKENAEEHKKQIIAAQKVIDAQNERADVISSKESYQKIVEATKKVNEAMAEFNKVATVTQFDENLSHHQVVDTYVLDKLEEFNAKIRPLAKASLEQTKAAAEAKAAQDSLIADAHTKQAVQHNVDYYKNLIDSSEKGSKQYNDALRGITKEQAHLKDWDVSSKTSTSTKSADRQARNLQKANEKLIQLQAEISNSQVKAEQDKQQAVIDAMNDGFAKKEAQQALDQEKELLQIKIYAQKQQKTLLEAGKETYIQNNKGSEKGWSVTDFNTMTQTGKPMKGFSALQAVQFQTDSAKITQVVSDMTANIASKYAYMRGKVNDEVDQMTTKEQQKFASSLSKQLADIDAYYNAQLDKAEGNAALMTELKKNWLLASNQATMGDSIKQDGYQKELDLQKVTDLQSIGMKELAERTKYEIEQKYEQLELNNLLKLGAAATDADKQRIAVLKGLLAAPDPNAGDLNGKIKASIEGLIQANPKLKEINAEAQKMGGYVAAGLEDVKSAVGGMLNETEGQILDMGINIAKGFASGGLVGGAMATLGEGVKLVGDMFSSNARQAAALTAILQAQIALQNQYNLALLKTGLEAKQLTNIFGTDELGKALNDIKIYEKASLDAQNAIKGNAPKASDYTGIFSGGQAAYQQAMDKYKQGFEGLASLQVATGHEKTGLFGWGKGKDTYSGILDAYPKLIDANGKFDESLAKTIISTQKMSDTDKAALQNMIDLTDQATQAQDALASSLSSIFGQLGDESSTAFINMAQSGDDAFSHIEGSASDMLKNIAKQIIQSDFLQPIFDKAQTQIQALYKAKADGSLSDADFEKQIAAIMGDVVNQEKGVAQQSQTIYDTMNQAAANAGIDMNAATTRTGTTTAGLASASQDSINALTGTMLALQSAVADVRNLATEDQLIFKTMQSSLDAIASNTAYCQHLEGMASIIQDIQLRGVIVRTTN